MTALLFVPTAACADTDAAIQSFAQALGNAAALAPFESLGADAVAIALAAGNFDDLLEEIYKNAQADAPVRLIKGFDAAYPYSLKVNVDAACALGAKVVLVGAKDKTDKTELAIFAQAFGGKDGRVVGAVADVDADGLPFAAVSTVDADFAATCAQDYEAPLSPSAFRAQLVKKAQDAKKRIVLPEGDEPRTVEAASICQRRGIAQCVLLAKPDDVKKVAAERGVELPEGIEIVDPTTLVEKYVAPMVERRKGKLDEAGARQQLQDTVVLGTMMLQMGDVDGLVSGAVHTTANTIRPAFQLIKTAERYSLVSSVFFMLLPDQVVAYADCAVNPNPNAEQLAEIAIQTAESARAFGIDPKVAMISYSTGTSGAGVDVDLVAQATAIVREREPSLAVDGPLQYDAATVASVAKSKAPDSSVAGKANVFIFPSLSVGNALYKAVQRTAGVLSVGPMLQGLNKPVNDLSRGALVDDIVYTIALTAVQADG